MAAGNVLGPILEVMTWVGLVPGLPLLLVGWLRRRRRCPWISTPAEVVAAGNYTGFRWADAPGSTRLTLLPRDEAGDVEPGNLITVHFDSCHPARWSLTRPRHDNTLLILGWILTAVGILSVIGGFLLLLAGA
ncbi:hypothetical protein [Arthrobacter sp. M4]|uniref:hypothetical protein n=1 Tax=Arthrobacter sp. M4 TaxID=218160 RepID=UPI001CDD5FFC|nr:hypothetical protein [Arthrobacter sp. M4]MCA4135340.1 hypothetical protein [Arthrobacter sp. M4]